jgi:isoquinoline 1-oxidoreductase beta subunit
VALHQSFGSVVAQVAEVSVSGERGADKTVRVHRVVCVIDCGTAVNPNLIRQQMDSAIVFGLGAALHGQIDIVQGRVQQGNFHDLPMLRMADCPAITTEIIASSAHPEGVGEPGTPPVAPAVANALFALTGQRLRTLPLKLA